MKVTEQAITLLSQLTGVDESKINEALLQRENYQTILIPKRSGGKRRIDIPPPVLKAVQRRILRYCFYHLVDNLSDGRAWWTITGFRKGSSITLNTSRHSSGDSFFQIDLTDAFPTVTEDMVRSALEILGNLVIIKRMFRFRQLLWFRRLCFEELGKKLNQSNFDLVGVSLFKHLSQQTYFPWGFEPIDVINSLCEILVLLTTYQGRLPQGAPTSPFLLNLVLVNCQLPQKITSYLSQFGNYAVSIYADDITISTPDDSIPEGVRSGVVKMIKTETPFRVNSRKTRYTLFCQRTPVITGLTIQRGSRKITVPKREQRRIRALLHQAVFNPDLRERVLGTVAFLRDVYMIEKPIYRDPHDPSDFLMVPSFFLPAQINTPYRRLLQQMAEER